MHRTYTNLAITVLALEAAFAIVWFIFLTMSFVNDSPYELTMFLSGLHFLGAYLVFVVARKLYKNERISYSMYTYFFFFTIIALFCARNLYQAWYTLPLRLVAGTPASAVVVIDQFQTFLRAVTIIALILSGLEWLWFVSLASHQFNKEYYAYRKTGETPKDPLTIVFNVPDAVLRGLRKPKYGTL